MAHTYLHSIPVSFTTAAWSPVLLTLASQVRSGTYRDLVVRAELLQVVKDRYSPTLDWLTVNTLGKVLRALCPEPYPRVLRVGGGSRDYQWMLPPEVEMQRLLEEQARSLTQLHLFLYGEHLPINRG